MPLINEQGFVVSSPAADKRDRERILRALERASSTKPVSGPLGAAAQIAQGALAGYEGFLVDQREAEGRERASKDFARLFDAYTNPGDRNPGAPQANAPGTPPLPGGPLTESETIIDKESPNAMVPQLAASRDAIASIESAGSGDYGAVGPVTRSGDRAYGKYQVMGSNVGPWTREAIGREMTPAEFLADPQAQDAVFNHRFGGYMQQFGNRQDAASMWFTGRPAAEGANRRDILGTTGQQYVDKFNAALGSGAASAGGQPPGGATPAGRGSTFPAADFASVMSNPYATEGQQRILAAMMGAELKARAPQKPEFKVVDGRLMQIAGDQVTDVTPPSPGGGQAPMFSGKAVNAQALNHLVATGQMTRDEAADWAAGKVVVGPDGAQTFLPASAISQLRQSTGAAPASPGVSGGVAPVSPPTIGNAPGVIPLTRPKSSGFNEGQGKAAGFADRMTQAEEVISKFGQEGTSVWNRTGQDVGGVPAIGRIVGPAMTSDDFKKLDQAERNFVNAILRRESGAVINPQEFDNAAKQYFPQPGDTPEVIAQKAENRRIAIESMRRDAGPAYQTQQNQLPTDLNGLKQKYGLE